MTLCVKTGMAQEYAIAKKYFPHALNLTGMQSVADLHARVPQDCAGIVSFGLCGGLAPEVQLGQAFVYSACTNSVGNVLATDISWRRRLAGATRYYVRGCYSSGFFNTANTVDQRRDLYHITGCVIIDDETAAVAQFALERKLPWAGLRVVSDTAYDNLPPAVMKALNPDGTDNLRNVIESIVADPLQIPALIKTALEFKKSLDELETAAIAVGPNFCWTSR